MKRIIPAAIIVAAALALSPAQAASKNYIAGSAGDATIICRTTPTEVNIGGACFARGGGSATVKIADAHGQQVGFWFQAVDAAGNDIGDLAFGGCVTATSGKTLSLPAATARLEIFLDGPAFAALDCPDGLAATNGTITVV